MTAVPAPAVLAIASVPPYKPSVAHVHHMYFRVDLDIDGQYPHDVFEVFDHASLNDPGGDGWTLVADQGKTLR